MGSGPILSTPMYCPFWVHPSVVPFWAKWLLYRLLALTAPGLKVPTNTHVLALKKQNYIHSERTKSEKVVFAIHNDHQKLCCCYSEIIGYPRIDWCACFKVVFSSSVQITTSAFSLWQNHFMHVQHRSQQATARGCEGEKFWQAIDP